MSHDYCTCTKVMLLNPIQILEELSFMILVIWALSSTLSSVQASNQRVNLHKQINSHLARVHDEHFYSR